jgi:diguanylate cyclase (GGDEF)-like protein/PAS domain S-box-containing protein
VRKGPLIKPFTARGRRTVAAILLTFALFSALSVTLSIRTAARLQHRASVVQVAARQRTLAERYVGGILLVRHGAKADPARTATLLVASAQALLDGGLAPAVEGDDDETALSPATGSTVRAQLEQERRLAADLTATGATLLAHRPVDRVRLTAHEHLAGVTDPLQRLRVLAALTSNVSLDAARSIAVETDRGVASLITTQVVLGVLSLLVSLALAWALIAATRRQTAHFRSLVTASTDLVLVFGAGGCRYASHSVATMLDLPHGEILGNGFSAFVHEDDRTSVHAAVTQGEPHELLFRVRNKFGEWRHLEAHITDLRATREIRGVVVNARDVTERVGLEEQLTRQAFYDGLTGLANRALFRDRLGQALARTSRSHQPLAVLLVDLDGFKQVNDLLGHDAGDQLLQVISSRFTETIRAGETLARLGGDEFALVLEGADEAGAVASAERLLSRVSEPVTVAGHELAVGASVGVVVHSGGPADREELIRRADVAMYAAKEAGRGVYALFRDEMARDLGETLGLEHELRLGLGRGEFAVHYQPEICLETGAITGVEALLRWTSPTRGSVSPAQFIPIAESTGLILPLGEFVLDAACRQTAEWRRDGILSETFVTWVNLSGRQLTAGGISGLVRARLEAAGLPPSFLGLEVTETVIVADGPASGRARAELEELHTQGVRIAIDDFGTGFSSLGQLRTFPIDVIKVDRSFIQGIEENSKDAAIATNVISLAHALGLLALAEGIETEGQRSSLRELGCDLAQGFLFAQPAPADEITRLLAGHDPASEAIAA